MYVFSEVGNTQYGNSIDTRTKDSSVHLKAIAPTFFIGYGITDNMELDVAPNSYGTTPLRARGRHCLVQDHPIILTILG